MWHTWRMFSWLGLLSFFPFLSSWEGHTLPNLMGDERCMEQNYDVLIFIPYQISCLMHMWVQSRPEEPTTSYKKNYQDDYTSVPEHRILVVYHWGLLVFPLHKLRWKKLLTQMHYFILYTVWDILFMKSEKCLFTFFPFTAIEITKTFLNKF